MAQTTRLASFGPVLIISVLPVAFFVDYNRIYYKTLVCIYKNKIKIKKMKEIEKLTHLWPK